MASHLIRGRWVDLPVEVRDATACTAMYLVRADAARAVIAYSGLDVTEALPGKAVCVLLFVEYRDSDLGVCHEFGVAFLVRPPEAAPPPARSVLAGLTDLRMSGFGVFIHWLPVDQALPLEAGRRIWGLPAELAEVDLRLSSPYKRCILRRDGRLVLDLLIRPGLPTPMRGTTPMDAYAHRDGVTRRTRWTMRASGVRSRPGGALIRLGDHPVAKELSELGLPKRALLTTTIARLRMSFGPAF